VRTVYHCFAASGAGACITAGTAMSERLAFEPWCMLSIVHAHGALELLTEKVPACCDAQSLRDEQTWWGLLIED
jgi:hypothetical protein